MTVPLTGILTIEGLAQEALYGTYGSGTITPPIHMYDLMNGGNSAGSGNSYPTLNQSCLPNPADGSLDPGVVRTVVFVAALTETTSAWSNITNVFLPGTNAGWDNLNGTGGAINTPLIIAQAGETSSAASYCNSFTSGGYSDWILGSLTEVVWMTDIYNDSTLQNIITGAGGTAIGSGRYWTSSSIGTSATTAYATSVSSSSNPQKSSIKPTRPQKTVQFSTPTSQYSVGDLALGGIVFKVFQLNWT